MSLLFDNRSPEILNCVKKKKEQKLLVYCLLCSFHLETGVKCMYRYIFVVSNEPGLHCIFSD